MQEAKESARHDVIAVFFLIIVAVIIYALSFLPSKTVLRDTVYFMVLVIAYHLYLQLRSYFAQNGERRLLNKLFENFPRGMSFEKIHSKMHLDKGRIDALVTHGFLSKHGSDYVIGPHACPMVAAWQSEITNRQLFLLSVTILVVSVIILSLQLMP